MISGDYVKVLLELGHSNISLHLMRSFDSITGATHDHCKFRLNLPLASIHRFLSKSCTRLSLITLQIKKEKKLSRGFVISKNKTMPLVTLRSAVKSS